MYFEKKTTTKDPVGKAILKSVLDAWATVCSATTQVACGLRIYPSWKL